MTIKLVIFVHSYTILIQQDNKNGKGIYPARFRTCNAPSVRPYAQLIASNTAARQYGRSHASAADTPIEFGVLIASLIPMLFDATHFILSRVAFALGTPFSAAYPDTSNSALRHNHHPQTPRLPNHTPTQPLQTQPLQPSLLLLNLGNLIHMLQADRADRPQHRIPRCRGTRTRLPLRAVVVVHGPGDVAGAADLGFRGENAGGGEEERGCWGCAEGEVETAVWADGDAGGDGGAGNVVGGTGVEFLGGSSVGYGKLGDSPGFRRTGQPSPIRSLQNELELYAFFLKRELTPI